MDDDMLRAHARWVADTARVSRQSAAAALDGTSDTAVHAALLLASEDATNWRAGDAGHGRTLTTLDSALAAGGQLQRDAMALHRELSHLLDVLADMASRSLAVLGDAEPRDVYDQEGNYLGKVAPAEVRR